MKKLSITLVLIGLLVSCKTKEIKQVKNPPNIVIIYADDLGWVDVGYNKHSKFYETPYIDKLASEGLILNRFYPSAANCAPSRASMMSGMYSPKHGVYLPQGLSRGGAIEEMRFKVPDSTKYFCQSEAVAYYLQKYVVYRKRKIYVGEKNLMDLEPMFNKFKTDKFLLPSSDILNPDTVEFLNNININWKRAQLFKTVTSDLSDLRDVYYDILVFFSPSGIESLFKNFPDFKQNNTKIAVFGNTTVEAADNANLRIDIKAPTKESPSMTMAIEKYIQKLN